MVAKKTCLPLNDIGERAEDAFLAGIMRSYIPAALEHAVRVTIHGIVFNQRLNGDVASAVARPVRGEAAGDFVVTVSVDPEFRVSAVDGVRFPAGIGYR